MVYTHVKSFTIVKNRKCCPVKIRPSCPFAQNASMIA